MSGALHTINFALTLTLLGGSLIAWPLLPAEIPAHFGADGTPTRWEARSLFGWFGPPVIAVLLVGMNYGIAAIVGRYPKLINLPNKKRFLDLPPEHREPVLRVLREMLHAMSASVLVIFGLIQLGAWRAAIGSPAPGYIVATLVVCVLITPLLLIVWLPRIDSTIKQAERAAAAEVTPTPPAP